MKRLAFLNYRRVDAPQAAQGLFAQLRDRFGPSQVFMDVGSIQAGALWPDRIRGALDEAVVMLSVIGPGWLTAADKYGRRRLDCDDDWVRQEIIHALDRNKMIIPVLVAGATQMPPLEGLPAQLHGLCAHEAIQLRDDKWDHDLSELVRHVETKLNFVANAKPVVLPQPEVRIAPLSELELDAALSQLPGWEPVESMVPGDYPNARYELRRIYRFRSFKRAIQFMAAAVDPINKAQHHPRWENQWTTVSVHLTTWDIGNRVSQLDVDLAHTLDALYQDLRVSRGK